MTTRSFTVICAWCHRIVRVAAADEDITHTICESCFDWTLTHPSASTGVDAVELAPRGGELFADLLGERS
jgi:hypothetical protein